MCCIFTCCGWVIDLVQRFWTFTMSCFISSAVCCSMVTASMSGVALGYNYSLAEYIELKETNVSVYLKRGVFDDEVVDEMDWRRGGGGPAAAKADESTPAHEELYTSGRRSGSMFDADTTKSKLDNSIFQSDEHYQFEGSLLKLTAKPVDLATPIQNTPYSRMAEVIGSNPQDSVEQMKAFQSLVNRRKMDYGSTTETVKVHDDYKGLQEPNDELKSIQNQLNQRRLAAKKFATSRPTKTVNLHPVASYPLGLFTPSDRPPRPGDSYLNDGRRMMESGTTELSDIMSLVRAQENEKGPPKWYQPKPPNDGRVGEFAPLPTIKTPRPGPLRPRIYLHSTIASESSQHNHKTSTDFSNLRRFDENFMSKDLFKEKFGAMPDVVDEKEYVDAIKVKDYSDEEIKGLPLRKKRGFNSIEILTTPYINTIYRKPETANKIEVGGNKNLKDKLVTIIRNINDMFTLNERVKPEISKLGKNESNTFTLQVIPQSDNYNTLTNFCSTPTNTN